MTIDTTLLNELHHDLVGRELAELSVKLPKKPLVIFFGRPSFCDNSKYLYLETLSAARDYEVLWFASTRELADQLDAHGLPNICYADDSANAIRLLLEASVAVFCENMNAAFAGNLIFVGALAGAQKIQLWHGVSVKHLDLMLLPHLNVLDRGFRHAIRLATRTEYLLSTASCLDAFWSEAFGSTQLVRAGHPRNAVIVREPTAREMIGAELPPEQLAAMRDPSVRRIIVATTWQRTKRLFVSTPAFYERMVRWAERENAVVFVKWHPFRRGSAAPANVPGRLYFLDTEVDIYPWLSRFDAMITDYSSIMFDYLFTGNPVFTFESTDEMTHKFEPDWSLVPDIPFRYPFSAEDIESVLDANITAHPLRASQQTLCDTIFETDPLQASAQLVQVIDACNATAMDHRVQLIAC